MYLRRTTITKNGKTHVYWRLVRSVRIGSKVVQETVAQLGELTARERHKASALARHFVGERGTQLDLYEEREGAAPIPVHVDQVRVENGRSFGDVWLGWVLWRALHLDGFCEAVMPKGREWIPWCQIASILVIARLCEPSSELHIAEDWYRRTALSDLIGVEPASVHHTRLYQGLDRLLVHKRALETHLTNRLKHLFCLDHEILLYDVTSTYFEGLAEANTLAKRGHSRDHRPDCKQVCIGLVVTREGYPIGYEVFAGNTVDVTTVEGIVTEMESRYGQAKRVWVMDRGMISEDNLEWLRAGGRSYLVGTPRSEMKKWERELIAREGWNAVREGLEVKLCPGPDGAETFILCRSADRQEKEQAMHDRFRQRIKDGLESLSRRLAAAKRPIHRSQVDRQIGRLLQRNSRASTLFIIDLDDDATHPSKLRLVWREDQARAEWARLTEGTYILRSNISEWSAEELWRTYIQLCQAEDAFRIHKSDLSIRPIWHHYAGRVQAHILVCFLAYAMWKTLQGWMERAGLGASPRTVLEEMHRIQTVDVVLPLDSGRETRIRCVVRPDKAQAHLLERLGIELPQRLKPPKLCPQPVVPTQA